MNNADIYIHLSPSQEEQMEQDFKNYGNVFIRIINYGDNSYRVELIDPDLVKDKIYEKRHK